VLQGPRKLARTLVLGPVSGANGHPRKRRGLCLGQSLETLSPGSLRCVSSVRVPPTGLVSLPQPEDRSTSGDPRSRSRFHWEMGIGMRHPIFPPWSLRSSHLWRFSCDPGSAQLGPGCGRRRREMRRWMPASPCSCCEQNTRGRHLLEPPAVGTRLAPGRWALR
jgi:hypothetical protein